MVDPTGSISGPFIEHTNMVHLIACWVFVTEAVNTTRSRKKSRIDISLAEVLTRSVFNAARYDALQGLCDSLQLHRIKTHVYHVYAGPLGFPQLIPKRVDLFGGDKLLCLSQELQWLAFGSSQRYRYV